MENSDEQQAVGREGWDTYWQGMQANPGRMRGGTSEQAIEAFWQALFHQRLTGPKGVDCLELAAGSGAVSALIPALAPGARMVCTDVSPSAMHIARQGTPEAVYIACDALEMPFPAASFDLVFSQFGVEYAGQQALREAAALVAPGGCLALVVHLKNGAIFCDYTQNLRAIEALRECEILPLARRAFAAGFALNAGRLSPTKFKAAERALQPAVRAVEALFKAHGEAVADGLPRQLYRDIAQMYPRMSAYQPDDIMAWVDGMSREVTAYELRLQSMLASALDEHAVDDFIVDCREQGFVVERREVLQLGEPASASGWLLVLTRSEL